MGHGTRQSVPFIQLPRVADREAPRVVNVSVGVTVCRFGSAIACVQKYLPSENLVCVALPKLAN
jgi:hypothetical protein